tara:strand:- start:125 stop:511 length:387 start_codon:yes stop_codon:yes gene_type:complete
MSREGLLLTKLKGFYEKPTNIKILNDIITKRDNISLRNIEWFVTTHCRQKKVTYKTTHGKDFTVHMSYKSSLDGYSKKLFDPFCRTQRIEFNKLTTTVAQLNFIKWCIENEIIDYIRNNKPALFKKTA